MITGLKQGDIIKAQERAKEWVNQWRSDTSQGAPASEPTEQQIISDKEQLSSLGAVESENGQERGHNAPALSMQGGSVERR